MTESEDNFSSLPFIKDFFEILVSLQKCGRCGFESDLNVRFNAVVQLKIPLVTLVSHLELFCFSSFHLLHTFNCSIKSEM